MTGRADSPKSRGPFRAQHLHSKDRYELHDGHPVHCSPTGGAGSRRAVSGAGKGYESFEQALGVQFERGVGRGAEQGVQQGIGQGRAGALRSAIATLCGVLSIPLDGTRHAGPDGSSAAELELLHERLRTNRSWESE